MIVQFWQHTIAKRQGGDNAEENVAFLLGYVSISVKEGHFACILVLDWISIGLA